MIEIFWPSFYTPYIQAFFRLPLSYTIYIYSHIQLYYILCSLHLIIKMDETYQTIVFVLYQLQLLSPSHPLVINHLEQDKSFICIQIIAKKSAFSKTISYIAIQLQLASYSYIAIASQLAIQWIKISTCIHVRQTKYIQNALISKSCNNCIQFVQLQLTSQL